MRHCYRFYIGCILLVQAFTCIGQHSEMYTFGMADGFQADSILNVSIDKNQHIYLSCEASRISKFDGLQFTDASQSKGHGKTHVQPLSQTAKEFDAKYPFTNVTCSAQINEQTWIGTQKKGIYILSGEGDLIDRINAGTGLLSNHITGIIEDKWNNIYFSTINGGFYKYHKNIFSRILPQIKSAVSALAIDNQNRQWIGTHKNGVYIYSGGEPLHLDETSSFVNSPVTQVFPDEKDRIWLGTMGSGLYLYDERNRMVAINDDALCSSKHITDVLQDEGDRLWIASVDQGIFLLQETDSTFLKLRTFDIKTGTGDNHIRDIEWTRDRLWFTSASNGIGWIDLNDYSVNLLEHAKYNLSKNTHKLIVRKNALYTSSDKGISKIDLKTDKVLHFNIRDHAKSNESSTFTVDDHDNIWTSYNGELRKINTTQDDPISIDFSSSEGLPSRPINSILFSNSICVLGTASGIYQSSNIHSSIYIAPEVEISDIRLFYESLDPSIQENLKSKTSPSHSFKYTENHFGFTFQGRHNTFKDDLLYSYRLIGVDEDWSPPTPNKEVNYANLSPGRMTLEVKAIHPRQPNLSSEIKRVTICITTPIWKQPWFPAIPIGSLLVIGYLFYRNRIKKIEHNNKLAQDKLKLQNKLLDLERSALQLQMNPHFIFNALNTIKKELRNNDIPTSEKILTQFSALMRNTLEQSRHTSISLEDEIELLHNYLSIEQISRNHSFQFKIYHDIEDIFDIEIPPMMLQPFVENAVQYGIGHHMNGQINIHFEQKGKMIVCRVIDNGSGLKTGQTSTHKSRAIQVTRDRLALLTDTRKEHLYIRNKKNENEDVLGVEVEIWLPVMMG